MKDILIVVSPSNDRHLSFCQEMKTEVGQDGIEARLFHKTALLLSGPKSYEISVLLQKNAERDNLPVSIFELESVLTPSSEVAPSS